MPISHRKRCGRSCQFVFRSRQSPLHPVREASLPLERVGSTGLIQTNFTRGLIIGATLNFLRQACRDHTLLNSYWHYVDLRIVIFVPPKDVSGSRTRSRCLICGFRLRVRAGRSAAAPPGDQAGLASAVKQQVSGREPSFGHPQFRSSCRSPRAGGSQLQPGSPLFGADLTRAEMLSTLESVGVAPAVGR
jgi:hypothetical protein